MTKNNQVKIDLKNKTTAKWVLTKLKSLLHNPKKNLSNALKNLDWDKNQIQDFMQKNNLDSSLRLNADNYLEILQKIWLFENENSIYTHSNSNHTTQ